jgi:hypothetical protein
MTHVLSALNTWSDVILVIMPIIFIVCYTVLGKWWKNWIGRAIVTLMAATSLIPLSKIIVLLAGISTKSVTYTWLEVISHIIAIAAVLVFIRAIFHVRQWRGFDKAD